MSNDKIQLAFAAINKRIIDKMPENVEITGTTTYAYWGKDNKYPNFLFESYKDCPTLQTIINGYTDYVVGDGVSSSYMAKPNPSQDWDEFITSVGADYILFGIAYIQVIRNNAGKVAELHWLDSRYVRQDTNGEIFYYNEDFGKKYTKTHKTLIYPKYIKDAFDIPASVIAIKTPFSRSVYGTPIWESAVKAVLTEIAIDDFHLSELDNNFTASAIINFNNGLPTDEQKDELEKLITKKFTGTENAGRFLLSFNNGKDNATTIERLSADDFDKRYDSLAKKTQKQIFTAFGVSPVVFGVERENTGFSDEDFMQAFKLFNRTKVQPVQKRIIDYIDKILGVKGSVVIKPFSIDWGEEEEQTTTNDNNNVNVEEEVK